MPKTPVKLKNGLAPSVVVKSTHFVWAYLFFSFISTVLNTNFVFKGYIGQPLVRDSSLFLFWSITMRQYNANAFMFEKKSSEHQVTRRGNRDTLCKWVYAVTTLFLVNSMNNDLNFKQHLQSMSTSDLQYRNNSALKSK